MSRWALQRLVRRRVAAVHKRCCALRTSTHRSSHPQVRHRRRHKQATAGRPATGRRCCPSATWAATSGWAEPRYLAWRAARALRGRGGGACPKRSRRVVNMPLRSDRRVAHAVACAQVRPGAECGRAHRGQGVHPAGRAPGRHAPPGVRGGGGGAPRHHQRRAQVQGAAFSSSVHAMIRCMGTPLPSRPALLAHVRRRSSAPSCLRPARQTSAERWILGERAVWKSCAMSACKRKFQAP